MKWIPSEKKSNYFAALCFLIFTSLATVTAWQIATKSIHKNAQEKFDFKVNEIQEHIEQRIQLYEHVLRGGLGVFNASEYVSADEWQRYVNGLEIEATQLGISSFGFIRRVPAIQLSKYKKGLEARGFRSDADSQKKDRKEYFFIDYLESKDKQGKQRIGLDVLSEANFAQAVERVLSTGDMALSDVNNDNDHSAEMFSLFLPVYRKQRTKELTGFVFLSFSIADVMQGLQEAAVKELNYEIYEVEKAQRKLIYQLVADEEITSSFFEKESTIYLAGKVWSLHFVTTDEFISAYDKSQPLVVALSGGIINFLVFYILLMLAKRKEEVELRAAKITEQLRESRERFSLAVEASHKGIWDWNIKSGEVYYSPRWKSMLGYSESEVGNDTNQWRAVMHPEDQSRVQRALEDYFKEKTKDFEVEYRSLHKDGNYRWIRSKGIALRDNKGEPFRLAGTSQDITEEKETKRLLVENVKRAISNTEAKANFYATMSHEIRTPLNGVVGMISLLQNTSLSLEQKEYLDIIVQSSKHLQAIVNDILDISKIEANKLQLEVVNVNLNEMINGLYKSVAPAAAEKKLNFNYRLIDCDGLQFLGDMVRVRQILLNLVQNAIKFTDSGSVEVRIQKIIFKNGKDGLRFEVQDTGIGINEEAKKFIFEPFTQADNSITRKHGGTGLGLSICKSLVNMMGGSIGFESKQGKGTKFHFEIPIALSSADSFSRSKSKNLSSYKPKKSLRILVAEDQTTNQKVIHRTLNFFGHSVQVVENGLKVLDILKSETFDVILMDCHMPELDGFSTSESIRSLNSPYKNIPIIALTADVLEKTKKKCKKVGMNGFVRKPVSAEELFQEIEKIFQTNAAAPLAVRKKDYSAWYDFLDQDALEKLNALNQSSEDDFVQELIDDFLSRTPEKINLIRGAVFAKDFRIVFSQAHSIKSVAAALGARGVTTAASKLESGARVESNHDVEQSFAELSLSFTALQQQIEFLKHKKSA